MFVECRFAEYATLKKKKKNSEWGKTTVIFLSNLRHLQERQRGHATCSAATDAVDPRKRVFYLCS